MQPEVWARLHIGGMSSDGCQHRSRQLTTGSHAWAVRRIEIITEIRADPQICFDCARDIDFHLESMQATGEAAIAGRTSGLIGMGETVTWRARHFGMIHTHVSRITSFDPPRHFRDEMMEGRFKSFIHDHFFEPTPAGTRMRDVLCFESPFGLLGRLVDVIVLESYLSNFLRQRCRAVKSRTESVASME